MTKSKMANRYSPEIRAGAVRMVQDMKGVAPLIRNVPFGALLADKAFDENWLPEELDTRGATAVIPPKSNRRHQRDHDSDAYKWRHLVETYFA